MRFVAFAAFALAAAPAFANDTMVQLGTGGLVFVNSENIEMASEHLFVSPDEIRVVYQFNNMLDEPQSILVAFPMPDIEGGPESMVSIPGLYDDTTGEETADPDNLFAFKTTFNGAPVAAELHQSAFRNNVDYSKLLTKFGIPLNPAAQATTSAVNAVSAEQLEQLLHNGLVFGMEYDAGNGWQKDFTPLWSLRSAYTWEATFPPGTSEVIHTYRPSVGGTVGIVFMPRDDDDGYAERSLAEYKTKYCLDDAFIAAVKKQEIDRDGWLTYPYAETWISYVWSTGNNWQGPIGQFTLTIDKGSPDNLVSFCGDNVRKVGPTTFEMTETDFYPPWDRELEILIPNRVDWYDE